MFNDIEDIRFVWEIAINIFTWLKRCTPTCLGHNTPIILILHPFHLNLYRIHEPIDSVVVILFECNIRNLMY